MSEVEEASLTWLQKQQKKLEERRTAQRRREISGGHFVGTNGGSHESNLMRELKTSLDRELLTLRHDVKIHHKKKCSM